MCRVCQGIIQLDSWLRLDPGRDSGFLVLGAGGSAVDVAVGLLASIRSKRIAKHRSSRKMGREFDSDDLEPGRVNVAASQRRDGGHDDRRRRRRRVAGRNDAHLWEIFKDSVVVVVLAAAAAPLPPSTANENLHFSAHKIYISS